MEKELEINLFVSRSTLHCAKNQCIPCFYKIFPQGYFPVKSKIPHKRKLRTGSEEEEFTQKRLVPNQRPEQCLRAKSSSYHGLYTPSLEILTVGDGDLSFSLSIARPFFSRKSELTHLTATTYETYDSLLRTYPDIEVRLDELNQMGVKLYHGVDATKLEDYDHFHQRKYDQIIWNFPCVRIEKGLDGQVSELEKNQQLIRSFLSSVKPYLKETSEIHITHKTVEPFSWWNLKDLARQSGYQCVCQIIFDRYNYPGYVNRKALDKKSFPCNDAQTFVFVVDEMDPVQKQTILAKYRNDLVTMDEVIEELQEIAPNLFVDLDMSNNQNRKLRKLEK